MAYELRPRPGKVKPRARGFFARQVFFKEERVDTPLRRLLTSLVRAKALDRLGWTFPVPDPDEAVAPPEDEARVAAREVALGDAAVREDPDWGNEPAQRAGAERLYASR